MWYEGRLFMTLGGRSSVMFFNEFLNEIFASSIATQAREVSLKLSGDFPLQPSDLARLLAAPTRPLQVRVVTVSQLISGVRPANI